jgi:hypothetical protein
MDPICAPLATVHACALSDHAGAEEFVHAVDLPGYSGLKPRIYDHPTRVERIPMEVRTLDGIFAEIPAVDYIKIDAEGGELAILRGAASVIERFCPVVTFEFGANTLEHYGITVEDMAAFWSGRRYLLCDVLGRRLDDASFIESAKRQEVWDYVALPFARNDIAARWKALRA